MLPPSTPETTLGERSPPRGASFHPLAKKGRPPSNYLGRSTIDYFPTFVSQYDANMQYHERNRLQM